MIRGTEPNPDVFLPLSYESVWRGGREGCKWEVRGADELYISRQQWVAACC